MASSELKQSKPEASATTLKFTLGAGGMKAHPPPPDHRRQEVAADQIASPLTNVLVSNTDWPPQPTIADRGPEPSGNPGPSRRASRSFATVAAIALALGAGAMLLLGAVALWGGDCSADDCIEDAAIDSRPGGLSISETAQKPATRPGPIDTPVRPKGGISEEDADKTIDPNSTAASDPSPSPASSPTSATGDETTTPTTAIGSGAPTTSAPGSTDTAFPSSTSTGNQPGSASTTPESVGIATPPTAGVTPTTPTSRVPGNATTAKATSTSVADEAAVGPGAACPTAAAAQLLNVTGVDPDDVLNVRLGPSTGFTIVSALAHNATGVRVYGNERSGPWVMIVLPGTPSGTPPANSCGWVNSAFFGAAATPV